MSIVLSILQTIGIVLLVILIILLLALLLVLFCPVRYVLEGEFLEKNRASAKIRWLLHLIRFQVFYDGESISGELNVFWKKKKFNGEVGLWYVVWYGFGRMFIEGLRTDSLYVGPVRISQLVGFLCFIVGAGLIAWGRIVAFKKKTIEEVEREKENG